MHFSLHPLFWYARQSLSFPFWTLLIQKEMETSQTLLKYSYWDKKLAGEIKAPSTTLSEAELMGEKGIKSIRVEARTLRV